MAIGHKVMALLLLLLFEHRAERDVAHERHCERVVAEVQTNSNYLGTAEKDSGSLVDPPHVGWDVGKTPDHPPDGCSVTEVSCV